MSSITLLRISSVLEGLSCVALFCVAMPMKYLIEPYNPEPVSIVGRIHGMLFVWLVLVVCWVVTTRQWPWSRAVLIIGAAIPPFGAFFVDHKIKHWQQVPTQAPAPADG